MDLLTSTLQTKTTNTDSCPIWRIHSTCARGVRVLVREASEDYLSEHTRFVVHGRPLRPSIPGVASTVEQPVGVGPHYRSSETPVKTRETPDPRPCCRRLTSCVRNRNLTPTGSRAPGSSPLESRSKERSGVPTSLLCVVDTGSGVHRCPSLPTDPVSVLPAPPSRSFGPTLPQTPRDRVSTRYPDKTGAPSRGVGTRSPGQLTPKIRVSGQPICSDTVPLPFQQGSRH